MSRSTVLMLSPLPPAQDQQLVEAADIHRAYAHENPDKLYDEIKNDVSVITTFVGVPCGADVMMRFPNLKLVANFGVGYDSVDTNYAAKNGIIVTHTPDVLTPEVADTALGLLLMTVRELPQTERYLRAGKWVSEGPYPLTKGSLQTCKLGIYGLGRIGIEIAKRAEAFGVTIAYHNRTKRTDVDYPYYATLTELAAAVNTLMVVVPGGADTANAINDEVLQALGSDGYLINVGRGSTVDEDALARALANNTIRGAGLDVFANEPHVPETFFDHPRVVLLPHVASASEYTRGLMAQLTIDNAISFIKDGKVLTPVPETPVA